MCPFDFVGLWVGSAFAIHVDVVSLGNRLRVYATTEAKLNLWRIWKIESTVAV
jgi:hypothetical protein